MPDVEHPGADLVALDVGDKRIGVAVSDSLGWTPQGLGVIHRKAERVDFPALLQLVGDRPVRAWIVGWPLNMDGTEGPRALKTRRFAQRLRDRVTAPVRLWDERLSTFEAEEVLREGGLSRRERTSVVDQVAAQMILKSYLQAGAPEACEVP